MGNYSSSIKNEYNESYEYEGKIYVYIPKKYYQFSIMTLYSLKGNLYIKENKNKKKEILIKGKIKHSNKKDKSEYEFIGEEIYCNNFEENTMFFMIKPKNEIKLNKIKLIKDKNNNGKIEGKEISYKPYDNLILELDLYNHKKKIDNSISINQDYFYLTKLKIENQPEEILINSLCGMKNLINTCYINSSFQILIHIPQFIKIILKNSDFKENIIDEINKIFNQILKQYKQFQPVINPNSFVRYFKLNHSEFNNYSQMDSEMFLEELIWDINVELGNLNEQRIDNFKFKTFTEKEKNFYNYLKESESETNFEINDLFYVYFIHEKKCKYCGDKNYYYDESPGLKLNFEHTKRESKIELYSLIMDNFKFPIDIKSMVLCKNCKKSFEIKETTRIAKLPKILILSLQKVNYDNSEKIPWIVEFPPEIGIREITDIDLLKESCRYKLFAINNHLGNSPKSGHYFSQIFIERLDNWYSFNDESVNKIKNIDANFNNYILFYKQIENN